MEAEMTMLDEETKLTTELLSLFRGKCGHAWVGATDGSYACPVCGAHDGDHHLLSMEPIAVQVEDWGCAWEELGRLSADVNLQGGSNDAKD
ncbi:MAG: hypothetical protein C0480_01170 [Bradyrhizobium sp.]|nr:hypothetical protein [Bradyrhizobium sp.]